MSFTKAKISVLTGNWCSSYLLVKKRLGSYLEEHSSLEYNPYELAYRHLP